MVLPIESESQKNGKQDYKFGDNGRRILVEPSSIHLLSVRLKNWLNPDGTAKSASEAAGGKVVIGPDDGDNLG